MEGIPEFEEIHLKFNREQIRIVLDQIKKNISGISIQCYNLKMANLQSVDFYRVSQNLELKRTVDYEDANVVIIKKENGKHVLSIFTAGLAKKYIFINIHRENLTQNEYDILLRILQINNIKLPISSKKWLKFQILTYIYVIIAFASFLLFGESLVFGILDNMENTALGVVLIFVIIIVVFLPLVIPFLLIYTRRIKAIKQKGIEIQNIEIKN